MTPHPVRVPCAASEPLAVLRPGGLGLTEKALAAGAIAPPARVLDAGCGTGAVVLRLRELGYRSVGVDRAARGPHCIAGRIEHLPVTASACDCVLCECVLSIVADPLACLRELHRVLVPSGIAVISDVYDKSDPDALAGLIERCGFSVFLWQEHTRSLKEFAAAAVLQGRTDAFCLPGSIRPQHAGYCLILSRKDNAHG